MKTELARSVLIVALLVVLPLALAAQAKKSPKKSAKQKPAATKTAKKTATPPDTPPPAPAPVAETPSHSFSVGDDVFRITEGIWGLADRIDVLLVGQVDAVTASKIKVQIVSIKTRLLFTEDKRKFDKYEVGGSYWIDPSAWKRTPVTGW